MSPEQVRISAAARLRSRSAEIEAAMVARIRNVPADSGGNRDIRYEKGQRTAVVAVLDYALTGIEHEDERASLIPSEAVAQACRAARGGVGLATIIRRYCAANAELADFLTQEADCILGSGAALRSMQRTQALLLDRLIATIATEYVREVERIDRSPEQHRLDRVRRLLSGASVDSTELGYDLDLWHLGVVGTGLGVGQAIRGMAAGLDSRLLCVACHEQGVWAWLGGRRTAVLADVERLSSARWPAGVSLGVGEPAEGHEGWRHTHSLAQDALLVSLFKPKTLTLYADVALLVPWLQDHRRADWIVNTYLSPLDNGSRYDATLRETLRAYFDAGRSASAACHTLNVSRRTIRNRMARIKQRLGPLLNERQAELELALQLDELKQRQVTQ